MALDFRGDFFFFTRTVFNSGIMVGTASGFNFSRNFPLHPAEAAKEEILTKSKSVKCFSQILACSEGL